MVMLNTNTHSLPSTGPLILYFPVSSSGEGPSPRANLVENENYLNILGELRESCVLSEPHFTCRVYGSTLSYCMTCLCSLDRRGRMKLKLVPGIYMCVCVRESACFSRHAHTGGHTQTHTHTQVQLVSNQRGHEG